MSKEHVYPRWLRTNFGEVESVTTLMQVADGPIKRGAPEVPFDATVQSVCQVCNNGWMSRLELDVQPLVTSMLRMVELKLAIHERRSLAAWIFKTVLMLQEQVRAEVPLIPQSHYSQLFMQHEPPSAARIWLCSLDEPLSADLVVVRSFGQRLMYSGESFRGMEQGVLFYGYSISLGPLMTCILGNTQGSFVPNRAMALIGEPMASLWPLAESKDLVWPPKSTVSKLGGFNGVHSLMFMQ